jgi:cellulose synthase/poly-beta-1,6-N-acetylglucosamine synthase-like glycosyltransferase
MFWYWFFAGPAVALALLSLRGDARRRKYAAKRLAVKDGPTPPVTVIVPVKGYDEGLRENLKALASLEYPDYELIVTAHCAGDIPRGVLPARCRVVLSHAPQSQTAEKVQNLLAAVRAARKRTEVFVFADSDGRPGKGWLRALVTPLAEPGVGAVTGYRWFLPVPADFWSVLRGVWDAVPAGVLGPGDNRFAWGGAMAIRKETFYEARVPDRWDGAVSDDYALSQAVRELKLTIAYAPGALTPSFEHVSTRQFFGWTRRQMSITRAYSPELWWPGLIAHLFYCVAMAWSTALAVGGNRAAGAALGLQIVPGMWKGWGRAQAARRSLPEYEGWFRRWGWAHAALGPAATWAWLWALGSSAFVRRIEWRGRVYQLRGRR